LIELLTVMAIISLLIGLLLPALAQARAKAQLTKDTAQVKQIHQSWVSFAREFDGAFPTPGLINRCPDEQTGTDIPGRGPEDLSVNNSAFMYSACIMQNFFSPQLTISPTEPSGYVLVKDDFDWSIYSPVNDIYWDAEFAVKLDALCNTSYSHTPICGERKFEHWKDTMNAKFAVLGTRGPESGADPSGNYILQKDIYENSVTLEFHGGRKQWEGIICFNDNHTELLQTFTPEAIAFYDVGQDLVRPDNIFRNDDGDDQNVADGRDVWLALVSDIDGNCEATSCDITIEWD
jgi:hypothetical protein